VGQVEIAVELLNFAVNKLRIMTLGTAEEVVNTGSPGNTGAIS
jgi:hypothetical protein